MIRRSLKVMLLAVVSASYLCACSSSQDIVSPVCDAPNYTVATLAYYNGQKDYQEQIKTMTDYIESAEKSDKKVAPGAYAHLGILYSKLGQSDKAKLYLEKEKCLYPESTKLIDFYLNKEQMVKEKPDLLKWQPR